MKPFQIRLNTYKRMYRILWGFSMAAH